MRPEREPWLGEGFPGGLSPGRIFPGCWAGEIQDRLTQTFIKMPKLGQLNPSLRDWVITQLRKFNKLKRSPTEHLGLSLSSKEP